MKRSDLRDNLLNWKRRRADIDRRHGLNLCRKCLKRPKSSGEICAVCKKSSDEYFAKKRGRGMRVQP